MLHYYIYSLKIQLHSEPAICELGIAVWKWFMTLFHSQTYNQLC